jgi:hypothetical protein
MSREWNYWDLKCRDCGNEGSLGIWTDDWNRWDYEISGFDSRVFITGAMKETMRCKKCKQGNVDAVRRLSGL